MPLRASSVFSTADSWWRAGIVAPHTFVHAASCVNLGPVKDENAGEDAPNLLSAGSASPSSRQPYDFMRQLSHGHPTTGATQSQKNPNFAVRPRATSSAERIADRDSSLCHLARLPRGPTMAHDVELISQQRQSERKLALLMTLRRNRSKSQMAMRRLRQSDDVERVSLGIV